MRDKSGWSMLEGRDKWPLVGVRQPQLRAVKSPRSPSPARPRALSRVEHCCPPPGQWEAAATHR